MHSAGYEIKDRGSPAQLAQVFVACLNARQRISRFVVLDDVVLDARRFGFREDALPVNDAAAHFCHVRLERVAEILAAGLMRLEARKSSRKCPEIGESSLHFTLDQSGDAPPCSAEVSR